MRKKFILIALTAISVCYNVDADELCLICIKANGKEINYAVSVVQNVTIDKWSENPKFVVNFKDGSSDDDGQTIRFGQMIPTSSPKDAITSDNDVNVYSKNHTIYVEASKESLIKFLDISGQQLGDCVNASKCECLISLSGSYIVVVDGQQFKINVQ